MNFYIRYLELQASPSQKATCDYHILSTFFYKLQQELSRKGSGKESLFVKFRRWWKGVNLFEKTYILIPIHEDLHLSLVIICFPEKKDNKSGPMLLHLDSLKLHYSRVVLEDITSQMLRSLTEYESDFIPFLQKESRFPSRKTIMIVVSLYFFLWSASLMKPPRG
ncbi:unnamed protein product [Linum trigynum]|uniref:Ubiquitin-like protease family profile domain-containing protein n=1 Tax=Linum trigynum TaxID=586398 RepID=A0AAV2ED02_9ROSI